MGIFDTLFARDDNGEIDPLARLLSALPAETVQAPAEAPPLARAGAALSAPAPAPAPYVPEQPPPLARAAPLVTEPPPAYLTNKKGPSRKDVLGELYAGTQEQAAGIEDQASVQGQKAEYLAQQHFDALAEEQRAGELIGQARQDIQRQAQDRIAAVNTEIEDLGKQTPDPHRYFKQAGTLSNVLTLIGVALGGYSSMKTGKNVPLEMLQREIDRDVQAQAQEYSQKLAALQEKRGTAKDELAGNLDALEFRVARQVDANNRVSKMIDAAASRYDSAEVQARAQQMTGELRAKNAELLESIRGKAVSEAQEGARIGIASRAQKLDEKRFEESKRQFQVQALMEMDKAAAAGDTARVAQIKEESTRAVFIDDPASPGKPLVAPTPKVAEELNKQRAAGEYLYTHVDDALRLIGDDSFKLAPIDEQKRRVQTIQGDLENAWSALNEQGVITAADAERYRKLFGSPNAIISNLEQLKQTRGLVVDKVNASLRERTGRKDATWRPDADAEYSTSVRPPGFVPRKQVQLAAPSERSAYRGKTPEQYQQTRERELESMRATMRGDDLIPQTPTGLGTERAPLLRAPGEDDEDKMLSYQRSLRGR